MILGNLKIYHAPITYNLRRGCLCRLLDASPWVERNWNEYVNGQCLNLRYLVLIIQVVCLWQVSNSITYNWLQESCLIPQYYCSVLVGDSQVPKHAQSAHIWHQLWLWHMIPCWCWRYSTGCKIHTWIVFILGLAGKWISYTGDFCPFAPASWATKVCWLTCIHLGAAQRVGLLSFLVSIQDTRL